jgi:hypothetical protein
MADANFDAAVAQASAVYDQLGEWIDRYHGGIPPGFIAAAITHESGGDFNAPGDPVLGEVGYLQVAAYVPPLFGYPAEARMDPESNIAIGVLEYEMEAAYWAARYPEVMLGTADSWKLARLAFAIGRAGAYQLADMARASQGGLTSGDVYHDIVRATSAAGGVALGSQSAAKVLSRVVDIDRQWAIGQAVNGAPPGPPLYIPDPPAGPYTIPEDAAPYFSQQIPVTIVLAIGLGLVAWLLYKGY